METLRVVLLKPSKYLRNGLVERFRRGFMPNAALPYLRSLTPASVRGRAVEVHLVDEYIEHDLDYLELLHRAEGHRTVLALVGTQSHQFHRALDLAAYARDHGISCCVIGGPHPMTCETSEFHGRGVSFALAEAELVWPSILEDAVDGELRPSYGSDQRWHQTLDAAALVPPSREALGRYVIPMLGVYPARGCPYHCSFCSVIKIAGQRIRSEPVERTLEGLRAAKAAGVRLIMFTSDNLNKYPQAPQLLQAMIDERIDLPFFVQCDTHRRQPVRGLLGRAGCWQVFLGVESLDRQALKDANKHQNHPGDYREIVDLLHAHGVIAHFSNILGFPSDTEEGIDRHVEAIVELGCDAASFYVLTPIPGTEQYDDFLARGMIWERNLDRFDTTDLTWDHPNMTAAQLRDLLFRSYRRFWAVRHILRKAPRWYGWMGRELGTLSLAGALFHRVAGSLRFHPMSGGVGRVELDGASDYIHLRRALFGCDLAPLPKSLPLSEKDQAFSRGLGSASSSALHAQPPPWLARGARARRNNRPSQPLTPPRLRA
jgi:hypothetical protein